jgi:hypothetical protein
MKKVISFFFFPSLFQTCYWEQLYNFVLFSVAHNSLKKRCLIVLQDQKVLIQSTQLLLIKWNCVVAQHGNKFWLIRQYCKNTYSRKYYEIFVVSEGYWGLEPYNCAMKTATTFSHHACVYMATLRKIFFSIASMTWLFLALTFENFSPVWRNWGFKWWYFLLKD